MEGLKWKLILLVVSLLLQEGHGGKSVPEDEPNDRTSGTSPTSGSGSSLGSTKDKYSSSPHQSGPSYYGYPTSYPPSPYSYNYNPSAPFYERSGKEFSTRTSNNMPMAASSNYGYGTTSSDFGGQAMAASHTQAHHAHGHGWGWQKSGLDTSALGLLGLIGLFSLLLNVLNTLSNNATTTTVRTGRKRRDDKAVTEQTQDERTNQISLLVLPALNIVAHARNKRIPLECTQREICKVNQVLTQELGAQGQKAGSIMSSAIIKLLKEIDDGQVEKSLSSAAVTGRSSENCEIKYPICNSLKKRGKPLPLLMKPGHFNQFNINRHHLDSVVARPNL